MSTLSNAETALKVVDLGINKSKYSVTKTFKLGFLGGVYVAVASFANLTAMHYIPGGAGRFVGSCIFPTALMLVVLVGGSLFTGDGLGLMAIMEKKSKWQSYIKNIISVWLGNMAGSLFIVLLTYWSGLFADAEFAHTTVHVAEHKLHLTALEAVSSGFLCNILVAIGVWFALATDDLAGKILAIWFPVMLFVFAGFQHVVANMYYVNIGLMLDSSFFNFPDYLIHYTFVTLGNYLSGGVFLTMIYRSMYVKNH